MTTPRAKPAAGQTDYVLGATDDELIRLGFQHQMWRAQAYAVWERAGFGLGSRLLDVGCGPGYTTLDLAQLVGQAGHLTAVDMSDRFVEHLRGVSARLGLNHVETRIRDVQNLDLPPDSFDGAYTRWVLCFVADPNAVIAGAARALRRGGVLAVQDYYRYDALALAPQSDAFRRVIRAVDESWRAHGGDPDVGCRLPALMERNGLRIREIKPLLRTARPHEPLWQWPATFFRNYVPTLVNMGLISEQERAEFDAVWRERSADPAAFFVTPPMIDVIAEKA